MTRSQTPWEMITNMADTARDYFDVESDFPAFLNYVLDKALELNPDSDREATVNYLELLKYTIELINEFKDQDDGIWENLTKQFHEIYIFFNKSILTIGSLPSVINESKCAQQKTGRRGRPSYSISVEVLENLRALGFTWTSISKIFGVSRWTIHRRVKDLDLPNIKGFSDIEDYDLDHLVEGFVRERGSLAGQTMLIGYLRSLGYRIQRRRIRKSLVRVSPENAALRWGQTIRRRKYSVPWPNSLWHLDGHHSLIRWKFVVHGCIDGFSRRIIFLRCSTNNLAQTVLDLFMNSIENDRGLWPSRVRVDYGVENVMVCDAMVDKWGQGRGSFIAGPSTRNQRIERLWRDVFRNVLHIFYYIFYSMEDNLLLNLNDCIDMFALQLTFLPRINKSMKEYAQLFNDHPIRTEKNWTPNQMWTNGMLHPENPLQHGHIEENDHQTDYFGIDPHGPSPFEDSPNNVSVSNVDIEGVEMNELKRLALEQIDPLASSSDMGIDVYLLFKEFISEKVHDALSDTE